MLIILTPGVTQGEIDKIFVGRIDYPMTDDGKMQLKDAAETLQGYEINYVYCSDLVNAQEALREIQAVRDAPVPYELTDVLRERSAGSYEGLTYAEIRKGMSPRQYRNWERDPFYEPLHGESLSDTRDRFLDIYPEIQNRVGDGQSVLLITHPDMFRVIAATIRGEDLSETTSLAVDRGMPYFYHSELK